MRLRVDGRLSHEFISLRTTELPDDKEVREIFNVRHARLELRQDFQDAFGIVFRPQPLGYGACGLERTAYKSNGTRGEHS
jgi:hypothetical protein